MSEVQTKTVNRLSVKQLYEVCRYLEDLSPAFTHDDTMQSLAVKASNHFGYTISKYSIQTCFEMADLKIPEAPATEDQKFNTLKAQLQLVCETFRIPFVAGWEKL